MGIYSKRRSRIACHLHSARYECPRTPGLLKAAYSSLQPNTPAALSMPRAGHGCASALPVENYRKRAREESRAAPITAVRRGVTIGPSASVAQLVLQIAGAAGAFTR